MDSTGNRTVDKLVGVDFSGNIIHNAWYKTIIRKNGKPDLVAINILADIVYWYRPTELRSEKTGEFKGYKKKFKSDLLQRSYDSYSEQFGLSKRQVQDAVKRLEELGIIKRVFRNIPSTNGLPLSNVLFIDLNFEKLSTASFPANTENCDPYHEISGEISQNFVGRVAENSGTYTNITPKNTPKIENNNKAFFRGKNGNGFVDNLSTDAREVYDYFIHSYIKNKREGHPPVNEEIVDKLNDILESGYIYDYDMERDLMLSKEDFPVLIDLYFATNYPLENGGYADHRIWHFLSDGVLKNLYYKELY